MPFLGWVSPLTGTFLVLRVVSEGQILGTHAPQRSLDLVLLVSVTLADGLLLGLHASLPSLTRAG